MTGEKLLNDRMWEKIEPLLPRMKKRRRRAGRPPEWEWRIVLEGILWILRTGAQWAALPECYPPKSTVYDRFRFLVEKDFFRTLVEALGQELVEDGIIDLCECFIDGTFASAKKEGEAVGKTKRGKGTKIMVICDKEGLPVSVSVASASPHEVTLVDQTLNDRFIEETPERLIGDGAYDSDPLDNTLAERNIEMIAPHKVNRVADTTQDGRVLRRYRRRWKVERFNAWIQSFRRVLVRHEYRVENYLAFVHLACANILLRAA